MTDDGLTPPDEKESGRLQTISDSVFAFSLTLLGTSLQVPDLGAEVSVARLAEELGRQSPSYAALVLSFCTVVIMWLNHHAIFGLIRASDPPFLLANGFLLLLVTVVPLPTDLVTEYIDTPGRSWRSRWPTTCFGTRRRTTAGCWSRRCREVTPGR